MGAIGIGGRGSYDIGCFLEQPVVRIVANCDVREERRNGVKQRIDKYYGTRDCTAYRDFRDLLARPDIDAVLITTGSNWHAMLAISAAKAGKDVYCEKPCSKTIVESLALADAFRRTARVFQGGMQRRSLPALPVCRRIGPARKARQTANASMRIPVDWQRRPAVGPWEGPSRPRSNSIGTCFWALRRGGPLIPRT